MEGKRGFSFTSLRTHLGPPAIRFFLRRLIIRDVRDTVWEGFDGPLLDTPIPETLSSSSSNSVRLISRLDACQSSRYYLALWFLMARIGTRANQRASHVNLRGQEIGDMDWSSAPERPLVERRQSAMISEW